MKIEEVRGKTEAELSFELEKMKKELFGMRFRRATETSSNPSRIRTLRRSIARVVTVMRERNEVGAASTTSGTTPRAPSKRKRAATPRQSKS